MAKKTHAVGDKITSHLRRLSGAKVKVVGKIKDIKKAFGQDTYYLTEVTVEDFSTRIIE